MALYLGPGDLERLFAQGHVSIDDCITAVEASFLEHGQQQVGILPRQILWAEERPLSPRARALKLSASYMRASRVMGASLYSVQYRPGDVDMWITLFSGETGRMLGILHGKALSLWKTGATAAVAARHMARADATSAALIGTGHYAKAQLLSLAAVRKLTRVLCFSRDTSRLRVFVDWAADMFPEAQVVAAESARQAVEAADIIVTITTSPTPVVKGAWIKPGAHCNAMGQHAPETRELDSAAVADARLIVDSIDQALNEKGELLIPMAAGIIDRKHIVGELGAVVAGRVAGRRTADEKTVFCSGGTALEYMGLCEMLLKRARAANLGQDLRD